MPIGRRLALTAKTVGTAFNSALSGQGGSVPAWLILSALKNGQWSTQLDLARSLAIEGPTLTRHLDNLERSGLVRRVASESDRRAVRVEITEAGEEAHQRMWTAVVAFNRQLVSGVGKDDLGELERILARLEDNARSSMRPA
jgi:MarR family transcriptional regulator, transcriptional regulator for hemolysin